MNFVILETNRMWEDREGIGHELPDRATSFSEETSLKDIWEWIKSDGTGEPRGNIRMMKEDKEKITQTQDVDVISNISKFEKRAKELLDEILPDPPESSKNE